MKHRVSKDLADSASEHFAFGLFFSPFFQRCISSVNNCNLIFEIATSHKATAFSWNLAAALKKWLFPIFFQLKISLRRRKMQFYIAHGNCVLFLPLDKFLTRSCKFNSKVICRFRFYGIFFFRLSLFFLLLHSHSSRSFIFMLNIHSYFSVL